MFYQVLMNLKFITSDNYLLDSFNCGFRNPCGLSSTLFYHPSFYPHYFIHCGMKAEECFYQLCRPNTIWNQEVLSCIYDPIVPPPTVVLPTYPRSPYVAGTYDCEEQNPCTRENAAQFKFYFPHHYPNMYIECDSEQTCVTSSCPVGKVWDSAGYVCDRPP